MHIGLLGFGTVGSHFYRMAEEHPSLKVTALLSRRPREGLSCRVTDDCDSILQDPAIDTVVELIGGIHPAYEYISAALKAGKHVVTANKAVMGAYYRELTGLAQKHGVSLRCTAAAGGGIPWLSSLARAEAMDRINAVEGILNGTTNYMLSEMTARAADYDDVLKEAQKLGYAEADPTDDVEGFDARRKLVLSANLAFNVSVRETEIPCVGISSVTATDIAWARERGLVWKLTARAERNEAGVAAFVCPTLFPSHTTEAHTNGSFNLVSLYAERIGKQSFFGAGAGGWATASNVIADCLLIEAGATPFYTDAKPVAAHINNTGKAGAWLFRSFGQYTIRQCSAAEAFEAFFALKTVEQNAILAYLPYGTI
ncbi:MAG: homoserine dehydrogenase [Clostridia bacterium]|nr:homoserine dehydrogenase [Clostridia bacterium]